MADDFTGTNTERIDKLIVAVLELGTTVRLLATLVWVALPMLVGLQVFLVVQSFRLEAKLDRLTDRVDRLAERVEKLERKP